MDKNKVAMSWLRPGRGAAGRLGGEWVDLGRGRARRRCPVLRRDPDVTRAGARRHGPAGPGGGRAPGPPVRLADAGRDGRAGGGSGGRRPRPPAGYRRRPRSPPSSPGCHRSAHTGLGRGEPSSPWPGDSRRRPPPAAVRLTSHYGDAAPSVSVHPPVRDGKGGNWLDPTTDLSCTNSTRDHSADIEHQPTDLAPAGALSPSPAMQPALWQRCHSLRLARRVDARGRPGAHALAIAAPQAPQS
jgi:hypothetical protein